MGKKVIKLLIIWLVIIMSIILQLTIYAADYRNATGYHVDRNDECMVTHVSKDLTNIFWDDQVNGGGNYQWSTFNNSGAYTDSYSVNADYGTADTYLCDEHDYNYINIENVKFECGKTQLIDFLNNIEGAGLGFDSELTLAYDTNYLPIYTFMTCPLDGLLSRLKINYYGFFCEYENCYVITGIRYQTKCSGFGFEGQDAFGNSGWYAGFEFGYGGGYDYPHNHCYGHPNEYTITYDPNCGSGTINNLNCLYNSSYNLTNGGFIRLGWRLTGWKDKETNQTYSLGQSFTNLTATQGKVFTMFAIWEDVNPPTIYNLQNLNGWTNQTVTISPNAIDYESGMKSFELYDGTTLLTSGIYALNHPFFDEQNKIYKLKAIDNAGNTSYRDFTVSIDKTPPDMTINGIKNTDVTTVWTNQKLTVNVSIDEALSGLARYKISYADGTVLKESNYSNSSDFMIQQRKYIITKAMQYMFGRNPKNQAEIDNWHNVIMSWGLEIQNNFGAEIFKQFYGNREYMDGYGASLSNEQFVMIMYNLFLCREWNVATDGTFSSNEWIGRLNNGWSRSDVAEGFFASDEYKSIASTYGFPTRETFKNNVMSDNFSFDISTEGTTVLNITTCDNVGNIRNQKVTVLINKNALKVNMPDYGWTNQNVPIHITASNTTGAATHYNLYNDDTQTWADGWNIDAERYYWVTTEGITHWKCAAWDDAGNYAEISNTVKIDKTAPDIKNIKEVYGWTNQDVYFNANIFDNSNSNQSGLKSVTLYDSNNNILSQSNVNDSYSYTPYWYYGKDYGHVFNANYYRDNNSDVIAYWGSSPDSLFNHFINYGIHEGRVANPYFDINVYKSNNPDVANSSYYGYSNWMILTHFNDYGFYEGWRVASNVNKLDYIFAAEQCGNYHVVANDMAGNSSRKDFTVKIDKTSPNIKNINITSTISANAFDNSNSFQSGIKSVILYDSNNNVVSQNVVDDKYSYNPYWSGGVDYGRVFNLAYYRDNNSDLSAWIGNDWPTYFWHYTNYGIYEGRAGSPYFDMNTYKNQNIDILNAFGNANWNALIHFNTYGFYEGWRVANDINVLNYTFPIEQRGNYYITVTDMAGNTTRNNFGLNNYIVKFDGNGGSGIMSDIINNNPTINLPTHTYLKENTAGNSKFLGWNTDSKTKMPLYMENDSITITTEVTEVTLYAIWDDCPIISGTDSYYTLEDAKSGKLSEEDLLKDVSVTDDWDSDFEKTLKIVNYNPYDFKQFTSDGSMVVKYQVTDSGGNTSYTTNIVYIVDTNPDVVQKNQYVRFINEDYYQKTSTDGGLGENSIWKTNVAYLGILEKAMLNRKSLVEEIGSMNAFGFNYSYAKPGSISQNHIYQSWSFDSDEIEKVKEYINTHGFGNIQEATALKNFLIEFGDCKK